MRVGKIKRSIFLLMIISNLSCNDSAPEFSEKLEVAMVGAFAQPADAIGTADPKSLKFTLTGASITLTDNSYLNLYQGKDPEEFRIISRAQKILEADLGSYVKKEIKEIAIIFSPTITGSGKYSETLSTSLGDATPKYAVPTKIETAKTIRLQISVQWKNTIVIDSTTTPPTETLYPPSLVLDVKNDDSN